MDTTAGLVRGAFGSHSASSVEHHDDNHSAPSLTPWLRPTLDTHLHQDICKALGIPTACPVLDDIADELNKGNVEFRRRWSFIAPMISMTQWKAKLLELGGNGDEVSDFRQKEMLELTCGKPYLMKVTLCLFPYRDFTGSDLPS